jgi:adhesin transport system outer membrane protein
MCHPFYPSSRACIAAVLLLAQMPASAQSLQEVVSQTLASNPDVLIAAHRRLALEQVVKQARGGYLPKVDMALGIGREWSENISTRPGSDTLTRRESSLTLSQMLYDGYAVKSEVERSQAQVESAAHRVAGTSERIALRTVEVYLDVLRRQELLTLTQDNLAVHERIYEQVKLRSESGVGRRADSEQMQARLSLAQANLSAAEANLREAIIAFQRVTGQVPGELDSSSELDCEIYPAKLDESLRVAAANHPLLRAATADYDASLAQERGAEAPFRPRADLELGSSWNENLDGVDDRDENAYAMLRMKYNAYRGGADEARVAQTKYLTEESVALVERTRREVEESTRLSWNALEKAKARLPRLKAHAEATASTRDAYAKQFSLGQRTLLDLLDSENELFTARTNVLSGQFEQRFAGYRLMADMGQLLDTLGVAHRDEGRLSAASAAITEGR